MPSNYRTMLIMALIPPLWFLYYQPQIKLNAVKRNSSYSYIFLGIKKAGKFLLEVKSSLALSLLE